MRCAIYTRVSTEEQTRKEYNSLESQEEHCLKYVDLKKEDGWTHVETYTDPGYTGGNVNRPGLQRLLQDAASDKFDTVLVYKMDRLTRSIRDFYQLWELFEANNVNFAASSQEINTTTSQGKLMLHIILSFAQYEREINSERVRDKLAQKAAKGQWTGGWVPFGYDYDKSKKILVPNEQESIAVNLMFEIFAETKSQKNNADRINALGYRTKQREKKVGANKDKRTGNLRFSMTRVSEILGNPIYLGIIRFKGKDYDGEHEGIIKNRDLWFKAAELLNEKETPGSVRQGQDSYTFLLKAWSTAMTVKHR
ncbi:MAG: recombinase family protein [Bdellovibrionota bacterium]